MIKVFQICFATGAIFTVVSFVLGQLTHFIGMDSHMDVGSGGHADISGGGHIDTVVDGHVDAQLPFFPVSPLKPIVIASFVTVFGGIGMICQILHYSTLMSVLVALFTAFATSSLLYSFIVVPLYKAQNTSAVSQKALIGAIAKTTLPIKTKQYGKITYCINGNTYSAPALSVDKKDIEMGAHVVIIDIKKNTFYVKEIKGGM